MDEIIKKTDKIEAAKSNMLSNTLKDRIKTIKADMKNVLLIDRSGSMGEYAGERTKYEIMKDTLTKLPAGIRKFAFDDAFEQFEGIDIPRPRGGTNMALAFREMKERGIREMILVTDGYPDSESQALKDARGLKINIIYIGPAPRPDFLEELAKQASGNFVEIDMLEWDAPAQLEAKIKGFLSA